MENGEWERDMGNRVWGIGMGEEYRGWGDGEVGRFGRWGDGEMRTGKWGMGEERVIIVTNEQRNLREK